jgi:hypothetical protein
LPDTLGSGSMWGLLPRHAGLVSHYGQTRGVADEPTTFQSVTSFHQSSVLFVHNVETVEGLQKGVGNM